MTPNPATSRSIWPVIGGFTRLQSGPVRTWAPPESPFRIEYSPELLREVGMSSAGTDAFGVLYGVRHGQTIRLVATRGRTGLHPVGVFASRIRGQVFLTEEDLERFDKSEACVALVISGNQGGFFVRDAAGSIETVRSYQEFSLQEESCEQGPSAPALTKVQIKRWPWAACLILVPLLLYRPHRPVLAVILHENAGQLQISWNIPTDATLSVLDGGERSYIPLTLDQSTATYARRSGDVTVAIGPAEARFVGPPRAPTAIEEVRAGVKSLEDQVASLQAANASGRAKIAWLRRRLQ